MLTPDAIERIRNEAYASAWAEFWDHRGGPGSTLAFYPVCPADIYCANQRCRLAADEAERKARENAERIP